MTEPTLLINSHTDGYEEDPELANTLRFEWLKLGTRGPYNVPHFILNGPEGQVSLIGREEAMAYACAMITTLYPSFRNPFK